MDIVLPGALDRVLRGLARAMQILLLAGCAAAAAQSHDIYKCVDDQERPVFQDNARGKKCERVDISPVVSVPASRARAAAAVSDARTVSPAGFPRVDGDTQRQRDSDRRRILEDEMRLEEERLATLRGEFDGGGPPLLADEIRGSPHYRERSQRLLDDIERSEANLASLKRELALQRD